MNKFNIESAKFVSIIIGMCLIFIMVVVNAYNYLAKNTQQQIIENSKIEKNFRSFNNKTENDNEIFKEEEEEEEEFTDNDIERENIKIKEEYVEIDEDDLYLDETSDNTQSFSYETLIKQAKSYCNSNDYASATKKYLQALELAFNDEIKAECYENLAITYAIMKNYNIALTYAKKAYNTYPNSNRELILARLYYKTGNLEKASARINNILRRDFLINDK